MHPTPAGRRLCAALLSLALAAPASAADAVPRAVSAQALELLTRSISYRTVLGEGQVPAYVAYLADVLVAGGFDRRDIAIERHGETATLIARWPGRDPALAPLVLGGHMDVVPANRADWQRDPFTAVVENGYVYGRGSIDNKFGIATMVTTLVWLRKQGFQPRRDIVLALSGDEETSQDTTAALAKHWKHGWMYLNSDAGGASLGDDGRPVVYALQAAEKTYVDFEIGFAHAGGHSSRPSRDNAIYSLARAIARISELQFPPRASELTRAYFRAAGPLTPGETGQAMLRYAEDPSDTGAYQHLASQPEYIGQLGTTCVATMAKAGHAPNALPQSASVNVNCRVFPGERIEDVQATLEREVDDPAAIFRVLGTPRTSDASPLRGDLLAALRRAIDLRAPGLPIVPTMSAGATDSLFFRNVGVPSYGVGGAFMSPRDNYAHGLDERVPLATIDGALLQWRSLLSNLAR
ncbi:MAG: M20/M25/M40 family metallo-hydrolase [Gammaproteobacteria bacterium]